MFEDSSDGDGGFYCIPRSHLRFGEFAPELEALSALAIPSKERRRATNSYLLNFFDERQVKHVTAPRGSLILWDSRTVHWNQHPSRERPYSGEPKVRMVGYLCYVPRARLTDEGKALRREAFETGVSTGHNPAYPELRRTKDHIKQEFEPYLEAPSYIQPKIHLTQLGESLLGI